MAVIYMSNFCGLLVLLDGDGPDISQFKEGVAKVTSKISSVASNVIETFQVRHGGRGDEERE